MIDYEKTLLAVGEITRQDLAQKEGTKPTELAAMDKDLEKRKARIAQLEQVGLEIPAGDYIFLPYTDDEKQVLKDDGAVVYLLEGESIGSQKRGGKRFWSDWHNGHPIEDLTSRIYEVAIWPDPEKFFVPGTSNKSKKRQEELVRADGEKIRARLGIPNFTEILPETPEVTEVMFRHFDLTNVRLLGEAYTTKEGYWLYVRNNTPTNESGSRVADVGRFYAGHGPHVYSWRARESSPRICSARWGVKIVSR